MVHSASGMGVGAVVVLGAISGCEADRECLGWTHSICSKLLSPALLALTDGICNLAWLSICTSLCSLFSNVPMPQVSKHNFHVIWYVFWAPSLMNPCDNAEQTHTTWLSGSRPEEMRWQIPYSSLCCRFLGTEQILPQAPFVVRGEKHMFSGCGSSDLF